MNWQEICWIVLSIALSGMAGSQIAESWVAGSLFKKQRDSLARLKSNTRWWAIRKICELLLCYFCLSHWTTFVCLCITNPAGWQSPLIVVYWFASVRLSTMLQQHTAEVDQTSLVDNYEVFDDPSDI